MASFRKKGNGWEASICKKGVRTSKTFDTKIEASHLAITRLTQKIDVLDLARMTGHRDLKKLMIYYNPTAEDIAKKL